MKGSAKLKDQARGHEQREEWEAAINIYLRVLENSKEERDVADLPLYNRVGDLYLRLGRADDAVRYYEQAAAQYAEAELYNNAIALCNKALRYAPARLDLLRRLGVYSASQGFLTDARHWFIEFAERAFRKGEMDAAFGALEEFARISEEPEIRELLARKLHAHDRMEAALGEFGRAFQMRMHAGDTEAAETLRDEVRELFPDIDLDAHSAAAWASAAADGEGEGLGPAVAEDDDGVLVARGLPGLEPTRHAPEKVPPPEPAALEGFEQTSLADDDAGPSASPDTAGEATEYDAEEEGGEEEPALPPLPSFDDAEPATTAESAGGGTDWPAPINEPAGASGTNGSSDTWVDLSDLLGVNDPQPEQSRFFIEETEPTGDEDRDFAELLAQFKEKLSEHIAHDDIGSHYDLGLAFKEMGLLDEAVNQFQTALRAGSTDRLKIYEELGHCFLLKEQYKIAVKVLSRALQFDHGDEIELIGVYYLLGRAYEEMKQRVEALDAYERVVGLDIGFKDVSERMARL